MTQERILELAWMAQLDIWAKEKERLDEMPENPITKEREERAYRSLIEIEKMRRELDANK